MRNVCRPIIIGINRYCMNQHIRGLVPAILIGVLAGYGALIFQHILQGSQYLFYQNTKDFLDFAHTVPWYLVVLLPALGGVIVGTLVSFGASEAKGHGVPEVMAALALKGGRIRKRVALVKIMASAICIGSGGSSGREGPMVQIGSGIGSTVGQYFNAPLREQKTLVGCGAAAGIAATFNAPIAGVLFALEVLIGDFGLASFSPVVLSSVTATAISRHYFGDLPAFEIPVYDVVSLWEFCIYPLLGIFAGVVAVAFIQVLHYAEETFESLPLPEWFKPAMGGALLGLIVLKFPHAFGVGYGAMNMALHSELTGALLITLVFVKIAATSCTLGSGGSGGIFAPSLFLGSMAGGFFGWAAGQLFPGITAASGAYALVGMGAVVAGTTHAPITAILIIFEMTGNYEVILPMMITCILATITASILKEDSIYTIKLRKKGIVIAGGLEQNVLKSIKVERIMMPSVVTIPESMPLSGIIETFKGEDVSYLHVISEDETLTGIISFRDIRSLLHEEQLFTLVIAKDVATTPVLTVTADDDIQEALHMMSERGVSQLPVVSAQNGNKVVGTLRQKDVVAAYDKAVIRKELESAVE